MTTKVQITLDENLLQRVDTYADDNYLSRSALCSLALTQYINSNDALKALSDIAIALKKIANTGTISEDDKKKLDDFEIYAQMLLGSK